MTENSSRSDSGKRFYFLPELAKLLDRVLVSRAFVLLVALSDIYRTLPFIFASRVTGYIKETLLPFEKRGGDCHIGPNKRRPWIKESMVTNLTVNSYDSDCFSSWRVVLVSHVNTDFAKTKIGFHYFIFCFQNEEKTNFNQYKHLINLLFWYGITLYWLTLADKMS